MSATERMFNHLIRILIEIFLTGILLIFHGMWTVVPMIALFICFFIGTAEAHAND